MSIWSIADLHLSFGVANKKMDIFGAEWDQWTDSIEKNWRQLIQTDDLVLIPGDISWAMHLEDAEPDLQWIHQLPGDKVILKGNHDYWWGSMSKMRKAMPSSIEVLHNNALRWKDTALGGSRLWDTTEFGFGDYIILKGDTTISSMPSGKDLEKQEKIYERELQRLELSLKAMDKDAAHRIALTHYPPISAELANSRASALIEQNGIEICVFGHLHSVRKDKPMFGEKNGVRYVLTSCDYIDFVPVKILST